MTSNLDEKGLRSIVEDYDVFFIDIWGVLHNGLNLFENSVEVLEKLEKNMTFKKKEFFLLIFLIFLQSCSGGRIANFLESSFNDLEKISKDENLQNNLVNKKILVKENKEINDKKNKKIKKVEKPENFIENKKDINLEKENKKFDDKKNKKIKRVEKPKNVPENKKILVKENKEINTKKNEKIKKVEKPKNVPENKKIFAIVATLGTTVRGAIDPIKEISEICKQRNIWLHIDGSIGGIFAITSIPIEGLNNINQANSITINPQKIIGITKTSSLLLVSNMSTLENTFNTGLPYISSNENIINRGEIGIQGSRPAEVIKLWLGLRFLGLNGIENILKSSIKRKDFFIKNISKNKFDIYSGPLHIVSFIPNKLDPKDSDAWTQTKVNELINNNFMLSRPKFKGRYFLRVVMGNYNTKDSHIEELLRLLDS